MAVVVAGLYPGVEVIMVMVVVVIVMVVGGEGVLLGVLQKVTSEDS